MTHVTCRLTAKNRDELRNPTVGNRVWATFYTVYLPHLGRLSISGFIFLVLLFHFLILYYTVFTSPQTSEYIRFYFFSFLISFSKFILYCIYPTPGIWCAYPVLFFLLLLLHFFVLFYTVYTPSPGHLMNISGFIYLFFSFHFSNFILYTVYTPPRNIR